MSTEVWFRNPNAYIREMVEEGVSWVVWDRGLLVKYHIDPYKHAQLYFGNTTPWRALLVGGQGATEIRPGFPVSKPFACYPVWEYGDPIELLEQFAATNVGDDPAVTGDRSIPRDIRPVSGQEHRIVVTGLPIVNRGPGRQIIRTLREIQSDHPKCIIHVHGLYGYPAMFGNGFLAVDVEPRSDAAKGRVCLPNGKRMTYEQAVNHARWVSLLGYKPVDLSIPRNRCMFNMRSALWAARFYMENYKFRERGQVQVDPDDDSDFVPSVSRTGSRSATVDTDKLLCDICTIQNTCKYYRAEAVCSIPGSEPARLAQLFQSRDPNQIIEGLGAVLAAESNRAERGMSDEREKGELDPEVTKMLNNIFTQGVKMAKLLNPKLAGGGVNVGVFVGQGGTRAAVAASDPHSLTAKAVAALEAQGIPRERITPEMIMGLLDPEATQNAAIGVGQVVDVEAK